MRNRRRFLVLFVILGFSLLTAFCLNIRTSNVGFFTGNSDRASDDKMKEFMKVYAEVQNRYGDKKSPEELMNLAMKGMVSGLDPYSNLFIGSEVKGVVSNFTDRKYIGGIGLSIMRLGKSIYVTEVFEGYSASKAGIRPGDVILSINGRSVYSLAPDQVVNLVLGKEGTSVSLEIKGLHAQKPQVFNLIREKIEVDSVVYKDLSKDIGYIKIRSFTDQTVGKLFFSLVQIEVDRKSGLIIDLRDNGGGSLRAVASALEFLVGSGKLILEIRGREYVRKYETAMGVITPLQPRRIDQNPPKVVVLINNLSASASEVMAGNLKHYKVATLIGVRTYGKATVQDYIDVERPGSLPTAETKLLLGVTTARYFLPDGTNISSVGVNPDIEVEQPDNFRSYEYLTEKDSQFQAALQFLRKK